jgi:hypothetical protein
LAQTTQNIANVFTDSSERKIVLSSLVQEIKELLEVDISSLVEKLPRALRMNRQPRRFLQE